MKRLWRFFSSITLTVILAALICLVAAWGSLLSMGNPQFFRAFDQEVLLPLLASLGGRYMGLTLWVYALIALTAVFSVNTAVCTADKVYSVIKAKRPLRSLFPHIVHVGFLIALVGHLVGSVWGFRSYGTVVFKGDAVPVPHQPGLYVRLEALEVKASPGGELEKLAGAVTLLGEDKAIIKTGTIEMNSPLFHGGTAFYLFDQGESASGLVLSSGGKAVPVDFGGSFTSGGTSFRLGSIYPDFALDESGRPYNRSTDFANPHVEIISGDGQTAFLDISRPGTSASVGGGLIRLEDFIMAPYVVLTINRDPGIAFIIAGSVVLVIGMFLLLFFRGERAEIVRRTATTDRRELN